MTIGYYYHIPISKQGDALFVPGYLGIFLDAIAAKVKILYLFMHDANEQQTVEADYKLKHKNIEFISLGKATPAWHRHLFHKKILQKIIAIAETCDTIIIRSPTPLAPFFAKYIHHPRLIFMVVGDYLEGAKQFKIKSIRDLIMIQYLKRNDLLFREKMRNTDVLVNSPGLFNKYQKFSKSIHLIKTTTLTESDFFIRKDTCQNEIIELLYTGRIEAAKGLFELVESLAQLRRNNKNVRLNIVGWEADSTGSVQAALLNAAKELSVENFIVFHGKKSIGPALNDMYRKADIYVIPSYHEGFPRTIWEAMANSLPVVATHVGGIPDYLTNLENVMFVEPKNSVDLAEKIQAMIDNPDLRMAIIANGYALAKENTIEIQTNKMIRVIDQLVKN
ncbi:MAG: glycosyltransferase family 4 protein [Ferruginibacter sp.]